MMDIKKVLFFMLLTGLFFFNLYFASSNVLKIREDYQHALKELEANVERKLATMSSDKEKGDQSLKETVERLESILQLIRNQGSDIGDLKNKVADYDAFRELLQKTIDLAGDPFSKAVKGLEASDDDFEEGVELPLQRWYENWKAAGIDIDEPDEPSVTIFIASNKDIVSRFIRDYGSWDIDKLKEMLMILKKMPKEFNKEDSDTIPFVDIGANIGSFTVPISAWGYRVHAFEIMPKNNRLLKSSLRENGKKSNRMAERLTHHPRGLDFKHRYCFVHASPENTQNGYTICSDTKAEMEQKKSYLGGNLFQGYADVSTLDEEIPGRNIFLMKIDVEGFEENVLTKGGATNLFTHQTVHHIISEVSRQNNLTAFFGFFRARGYEIRVGTFTGETFPDTMTDDEFVEKYGSPDVFMSLVDPKKLKNASH